MTVWEQVWSALARHGRCALVTIAEARGSVPREAGTRMVVTPEGYHGTIGGGALEWRAIAIAQSMLPGGPAVRSLSQALGPDLGQCCGGHAELAIEVFDLTSQDDIRRRAESEPPATRRKVFVFGAGHVGKALMLALAPLPVDMVWVDPRPNAFPSVVPQNTVLLMPGDPVSVTADAPEGSLAYIMTHSHALDLAIADASLRNPAFAHVGLIGSATKRARFEKRLREAGVSEDRITSLICPIGIAGIRSKEPAAIALATAAQIVQLHEALAGVTSQTDNTAARASA